MWLLRIIIFVALLIVLVVVAMQNNDDPGVDVQLFKWTFVGVRVWLVMLAATLIGFVAGLLVLLFREIQLRIVMGKIQRECGSLRREISDLRAAPLQDLGPTDSTTRLPERFTE